jgi:hypothetical protein
MLTRFASPAVALNLRDGVVEGPVMLRKTLLACGVMSSLLYVGADLIAALLYPGYHSFTAQAISELTAIGAPTRVVVRPLFITYDLLVMAFAAGLWMSARHDRQRVTALFVAGIGLAGLLASPFGDMNLRGSEFALNDMLHIAITTIIVLCIFGAVLFAAATFGQAFLRYSIVTLLTLTVFGVMAALQGSRLAAGDPTPWFGVVERIHIGAYLLWVVVLALEMWGRRGSPDSAVDRRLRKLSQSPGDSPGIQVRMAETWLKTRVRRGH